MTQTEIPNPKVIEEFKLRDVGEREVGIEIEMEGRNLPVDSVVSNTASWKGTTDGSLRGESSAEYVLSKPVRRDKVSTVLKELQDYLASEKAKLIPSDNAGVHVHINVQQLTFKQVVNFAILYFIFEDLLVKFCGTSREGNLFCLRVKDAEALLWALRQCILEGSFRKLQDNSYRYASLNFTSLSKYGSLEFRSMRSVDDFSVISTWVELLLRVKDASREYEEASDIIASASQSGFSRFFTQVFGGYSDLLHCKELDEIVLAGLRRVQDVAYTKTKPVKKRLKYPGYEPWAEGDPEYNMPGWDLSKIFIVHMQESIGKEITDDYVNNRMPGIIKKDYRRHIYDRLRASASGRRSLETMKEFAQAWMEKNKPKEKEERDNGWPNWADLHNGLVGRQVVINVAAEDVLDVEQQYQPPRAAAEEIARHQHRVAEEAERLRQRDKEQRVRLRRVRIDNNDF